MNPYGRIFPRCPSAVQWKNTSNSKTTPTKISSALGAWDAKRNQISPLSPGSSWGHLWRLKPVQTLQVPRALSTRAHFNLTKACGAASPFYRGSIKSLHRVPKVALVAKDGLGSRSLLSLTPKPTFLAITLFCLPD